MKILIIWPEFPTEWNASSNRVFNLLKHSKRCDNDITIITFDDFYENQLDSSLFDDGEIIIVEHPSKIRTIINSFSNFFRSGDLIIPALPYSLKMKEKINELLKENNFDLIYVDQRMVYHALGLDVNVPMVLDVGDSRVYSSYQTYKYEKKILKKIGWLLRYYNYKHFEVKKYKYFDAHIFVSSIHHDLLKPYVPIKNPFYIPCCIDVANFHPGSMVEESNCLVFTGLMSYPPNEHAVIYFYNDIYPLIKEQINKFKLFVVGKNPSSKILNLQSDEIVVTGFVEDIKPYISKAKLVIIPIQTDDGGFKLKLLEAMAMGKPIITTSLGAKGINVKNEFNVIVADESKEFADQIVHLLKNIKKRGEIGQNARKLIEESYSCELMIKKLNDAFEDIVKD